MALFQSFVLSQDIGYINIHKIRSQYNQMHGVTGVLMSKTYK